MKWATTLAVAAALVRLQAAQLVSACPEGWVDLSDGTSPGPCFYFVRSKSTWQNGRSVCQALGADLATLKGDLHRRVVDYINSQPEGDLDDEAFWIGGTDEGHEGSWTWIVDGSEILLGTPHWYPCGENKQPNGGSVQNHLALYTPDFYFHSLESTRQIMAICQL